MGIQLDITNQLDMIFRLRLLKISHVRPKFKLRRENDDANHKSIKFWGPLFSGKPFIQVTNT